MKNDKFDIPAAMKMAQWERAKGELNALVALQGSYHSGSGESPEYKRMVELTEYVKEFVQVVEDNAWHE